MRVSATMAETGFDVHQSRTTRLIRLHGPDDLHALQLECREPMPGPTAGELHQQAPDAHWMLAGQSRVHARCSLWWKRTPRFEQHRVGAIGHFAAGDAASARHLLLHACSELRAQGCTLAVGPMDGHTWRNYRLRTSGDARPAFLFEPRHPTAWPDHFRSAGFVPLLWYFSAINEQLVPEPDPRVMRVEQRLQARGVSVRRLCRESLEQDLLRVYRIACAAFAGNPFFAEMPEAEFLEQYISLSQTLPLDWSLIAEQRADAGDDVPAGFIFAVPDLLEKQRTGTVDTLIIKTLAILPERRFCGLGRVLMDRVQRDAARAGFRSMIHALMREDPTLQQLSAESARPFRRYCLFARQLEGER